MKLVTSKWEHSYCLGDGECYETIIENPFVFRDYIESLKTQIEGLDGPFVLSEKLKPLKLKDHAILIDNPLSLESSNKRISSKIVSLLKDQASSEDFIIDTSEILSAIARYAEKLSDCSDYSIKYDDPDIAGIIKILNFEIDLEYETPLERLAEYFNVLHSLCGISVFILVNAISFFSIEELRELITFCISQKHSVILLNSYQKNLNIENLKVSIIDEDCCEIQ